MRTLSQQADEVRSSEDLAAFVRRLAEDLRTNPEKWENDKLGSFLEAMSAWIEDMDGYFQNRGEPVPTQPDWKLFARFLSAARFYE